MTKGAIEIYLDKKFQYLWAAKVTANGEVTFWVPRVDSQFCREIDELRTIGAVFIYKERSHWFFRQRGWLPAFKDGW